MDEICKGQKSEECLPPYITVGWLVAAVLKETIENFGKGQATRTPKLNMWRFVFELYCMILKNSGNHRPPEEKRLNAVVERRTPTCVG